MSIAKVATTCLLFALAVASSAYAASLKKLPFDEGTYAYDRKYCKMSRDEAMNEFEGAFRDIGKDWISYYETYCEVKDISTAGKKVKFLEVCEGEGYSDERQVEWEKIAQDSFFDDTGHTWKSCGRSID